VSIETRVSTTRAALADMGRPDLADRVIDAEQIRAKYPDHEEPPVSWLGRLPWEEPDVDEEIMFRRAAALASLAEGYDAQNVYCERCIRALKDPGCHLVTRRQFLAHESCGLTPWTDISSHVSGIPTITSPAVF
jgi:hypothetical protein